MAITRRQFLGRGSALVGGLSSMGLVGDLFGRVAHAQVGGTPRYFISFLLDGGVDSLSTLVPVEDGTTGALRSNYELHRREGSGGLRIPAADLLVPGGPSLVDVSTGSQLGFNNALSALAGFYEAGKVAVVQGCTYPDPSLSHDTSRKIWQWGGRPMGAGVTGWLGRQLEHEGYGSTDIPVFSLGSDPREYQQTSTNVLASSSVRGLAYASDYRNGSDTAAKLAALSSLADSSVAAGGSLAASVGATSGASLAASQNYPPLHDLYRADRPGFDEAYDAVGGGPARYLKEVAKVIYGQKTGIAGVGAQYFRVRQGGYDTHSNQGTNAPGGRLFDLHKEVDDALGVFLADIADMGSEIADGTTICLYSEFGRRIPQNDTGTDHGTGGAMYLIGNRVQGGLYGNHPNIAEEALDRGNTAYSQNPTDPYRSTDIRDVYGNMLAGHFEMGPADIAALLPADVGDPDTYWTNPNFDLGLF
jgi:uncharacterized protein (DUF1501 family)